jgi:hypothetical protein
MSVSDHLSARSDLMPSEVSLVLVLIIVWGRRQLRILQWLAATDDVRA